MVQGSAVPDRTAAQQGHSAAVGGRRAVRKLFPSRFRLGTGESSARRRDGITSMTSTGKARA